jgi:septal ring factor EnvC (AmiA/AmiB activator)
MPKFLQPSPALLVAVLALLVAFAGTALAGSSVTATKKKTTKKPKVTHADAKQDAKQFASLLKNATSAPKLVARSALNATNATNATHATSADTATNATNATHATSADTATSAQPAAFALIDSTGSVTSGKGITNANVSHPSDGTYCITGLAFPIKGAQVTQEFGGSYNATSSFSIGATGFCPSGGQVILAVATTPTNNSFNIVVYG